LGAAGECLIGILRYQIYDNHHRFIALESITESSRLSKYPTGILGKGINFHQKLFFKNSKLLNNFDTPCNEQCVF